MDALVGNPYKLDKNIICISYLLGPARMYARHLGSMVIGSMGYFTYKMPTDPNFQHDILVVWISLKEAPSG